MRNLFYNLFFLLLLLVSNKTVAQKKFIWATNTKISPAGTNLFYGMNSDKYGNLYAGGYVYQLGKENKLAFGFVKMSKDGFKRWERYFEIPAQAYYNGETLLPVYAYDDSTSIYVLKYDQNFAVGSDSVKLTPNLHQFIAVKLDTAGKPLWFSRFGCDGSSNTMLNHFQNSNGDVVIHGQANFTGKKFIFNQQSVIENLTGLREYLVTIKKDGTFGGFFLIPNENNLNGICLNASAADNGKIRLLVYRYAQNNGIPYQLVRGFVNQDGTELTWSDSISVTYSSTQNLKYSKFKFDDDENIYVSLTCSNKAILGNKDTINANEKYVVKFNDKFELVNKVKCSSLADPVALNDGHVLWTALVYPSYIFGNDTLKNKNNQNAQHFYFTDSQLTLGDKFMVQNDNGGGYAKLQQTLLDDSLDVTILLTAAYGMNLDTIRISAQSKSWYHLSITSKWGTLPKIEAPSSVKESFFNKSLNIFPNPASDIVYIQNPDNRFSQLEIYNNLGQLVKNYQINHLNQIQLNLNTGIYHLLFQDKTSSTIEKKTLIVK